MEDNKVQSTESKNEPLQQTAVSGWAGLFKKVGENDIFKVTDRVKSGDNYGWITKITDLAVHVKWENGDYQKFFWLPKHHMQSPISDLKPCR